jgi:hypothetical protein
MVLVGKFAIESFAKAITEVFLAFQL